MLNKKPSSSENTDDKNPDLGAKTLYEVMAKVTEFFKEIVVKMKIIADGFAVSVFDQDSKELVTVKYARQEILIEIDLAFKEITTIRALGLEIQTKESLMALELVVKRLIDNMNKIKELSKKDISELPRQRVD